MSGYNGSGDYRRVWSDRSDRPRGLRPEPLSLPELEDRRRYLRCANRPNPLLWGLIIMLLGISVAVTAPAGWFAFIGLIGAAIGGGLFATALLERLER